jgi:hypothetical protein
MPVAGVGPHLSSSVKDAVGVSTSTAFFFCAARITPRGPRWCSGTGSGQRVGRHVIRQAGKCIAILPRARWWLKQVVPDERRHDRN